MSEQFYDEVIAPELARLGELCKQHDMSLLAVVEIEKGISGITLQAAPTGFSWAFEMIALAVSCDGNLDKFVIGVARIARQRPDLDEKSSMILKLLENV